MVHHWLVEVRVNGKTILAIESNGLCGKSVMTAEEEQVVRDAAEHLLAFIGKPRKEQPAK